MTQYEYRVPAATISIDQCIRAMWMRAREVISEWRDRRRSRYELARLNDRELWDLGLSRSDANAEAARPFWF